MNSNSKKEIQEFEVARLDVVATHNRKFTHVTGGVNQSDKVCDSCSYLKFLPNPDPDDWFRDRDMKTVYTETKATIEDSLERPSKMVDIQKPILRPNLGRELTE